MLVGGLWSKFEPFRTSSWRVRETAVDGMASRHRVILQQSTSTRCHVGPRSTETLRAGVSLDNKHANPAEDWLATKLWNEICLLDDLAAFKGLGSMSTAHAAPVAPIYD